MPINRKAYIRYQVLDRCFRNRGRLYSIDDLREACSEALDEWYPGEKGVSTRQIYDDIRFMESSSGWQIPLERIKEGHKTFYRYSDPRFSISNTPLTPDELQKVKAAIEVLTRFVGLPQFEWINEILPILSNKLSIKSSNQPVIELDSNKDFSGLKHIEVLYNAIVNKVVLQITYQSFDDPAPETFNFHPYYLKEYNNRWFVYGLNETENKSTWNVALDRIVDIKSTQIPYKSFEFDWESYFYDIIGVTRYEDEQPQEIELLVYPESAKYVYHKPLHPTQRAAFEGENLRVKIRVIPNRELINQVISYGKNIEVISPEHFRQVIKSELEESYKRYQ